MRSSLRMAGLPRRAVRQFGPALCRDQLRPAPVELAMVALAHAKLAGPAAELRVKALVPEAHLRVERHLPGHDAATGAGAFLPIVHVVLLEGAGRAEASHPGQPDRVLDVSRGGLVDEHPRPDLGLVGAARVPDAEGPRGGAQQREVREDGADDRINEARAGAEAVLHFRADL